MMPPAPESHKTAQTVDFERLARTALDIRRDVIKMLGIAASGHPGGSLSATDLLTVLYFQILRHDPKNGRWADRDRLVFSKGHGCPALYSALARAGYFSVESLLTLRKLGSPLQGHPDVRRLSGIDASTGSLGQGLSIAVGMGLAARFDKKDYLSWALISDGELNEGQIWEAAAFAAFHKMTNVPTVLDYNKYQLGGSTKEMLDMEPVADKWRAFGWDVREIDGHDLRQIHEAFLWAKSGVSSPRIVIAHTIKGKGVSFMEGNNHFHGVAPTKDETARALKELGESDAEIARITGMIA